MKLNAMLSHCCPQKVTTIDSRSTVQAGKQVDVVGYSGQCQVRVRLRARNDLEVR